MNKSGSTVTGLPVSLPSRSGHREALSKSEYATVSAISSRVLRVLGLQDRDGLRQDLAIVQANAPIDLDALAGASDKIFLDELLTIVDSTDRATGSLKADFKSRFLLDKPGLTLV